MSDDFEDDFRRMVASLNAIDCDEAAQDWVGKGMPLEMAKDFLLSVRRMVELNGELRFQITKALELADAMASMISLGKPDLAKELWESMRVRT